MLLQDCWAGLCLLLLCQSCWLEAARGLEEAVKCESITEATIGQEANFSCDFLLTMNVFQVTWQKINGSFVWNIATYSQTYGLRLQESFQRKARFTVAALNTSAIALRNLTSEDASCYRCIFNVFPHGSFSSPELCLKIQNTGNTNNKIEDKMQDMGSPNTRESRNTSNPEVIKLDVGSPNTRGISGIQKRISLVVIFIVAVLATLILLIVGLIKRRRRKLQKHRAHSTPEKEKGLQQDVCEQSISLETLKVKGSAYQNERRIKGSSHHKRLLNPRRNLEGITVRATWKQDRQTPGSSVRKWLLNPRRNREENKERQTWKRKKRLVFSEEAGSQDSTSHNIPQGELTELSNDELFCTLLKNNSDKEECEESELCPALATPWPSTGEKSAHQNPVARSPEEH